MNNVDTSVGIVKCSCVDAFSRYRSVPKLFNWEALEDACEEGLDAVNDSKPKAGPTGHPNGFVNHNTQVLEQDRDFG